MAGSTITNLEAVETPSNEEYHVESAINAKGPNFIEIKALLFNQTGWPARADDRLSFRYFFDISELLANGASAADITVSTACNQGAKLSGPFPWKGSQTLYYLSLDFAGTLIYPGGQSAHKKEAQFRIAGPPNTSTFDASNDWSFAGIAADPSTPSRNERMPVYREDTRVFGQEPPD
jgi:hypothetical protein